MRKIKKNQFLAGFAVVVLILGIVRLLFPSIDDDRQPKAKETTTPVAVADTVKVEKKEPPVKKEPQVVSVADKQAPQFLRADNTALRHTILSVPSYSEAFPDSNYVQMASAQQWGVSPVANRNDAEARKNELVYIGASPFYHIDPMRQSIPYLVPRAAVLLHDIGRCFYDSLQLKGVPIHQLIVTSVLRTREDVEKLRNYNKNATENSCHLYGTTFDIAYNRYVTVQAPGEQRRTVPSDTLKWVLSEVLNDMRKNDRCYIKYEVKQGCFHITTR